ncbi:MAG: hypothetical protein RIQ93_2310 [Verrucomicrobiota bacterium]|jgi:mono/diheme cytochrome c family protein/glucose/arabinose dehydrogenase
MIRFSMKKLPMLRRLALLTVCALPAVFGQIGDEQDKKGEIQKSLVPAELVPPAPVLKPEEALKTFQLQPGFKLEIAAADPLVQEPVAIAFGTDGRMWVVEMRGYMPDLDGSGEDHPVGRVVILRDRDGDGRYDESTVFVDNLILPRAITLVGDGALIGAPPELNFWRDTDGDGKADQKIPVATDYGVMTDPKRPHLANPERAPNNLTWAFDNWIYSTAYNKKFRFVKGNWETGPSLFRGQWGLSQDDFGHLYYCSNSDYLRVDIIHADYLQRNPNLSRLGGTNVNAAENQLVWPARVTPGINRGYRPEMLRDGKLKEFTAANSTYIYRGDLFPEYYGNAFAAEPSAHFVRRSILKAENGTLQGRNAYDKSEFLASTDERFRPVGFSTGPDGALYVIDLYRGILQHRISLTSYLRNQIEQRNLDKGLHYGRIYRVVPADRPTPRATQIAPLTTAQWVERLAHANSWWRETAQRILVERQDASVIPAIRELALNSRQAMGRVHALWTLDGMNALDPATVFAAIDHTSPLVRTAGLRLGERYLKGPGKSQFTERMLTAAEWPIPEVQLQAVLSLGEAADTAIDFIVAGLVRTHPNNTFLRDAFLSGLANRELPLLEKLAASPAWAADNAEVGRILSSLSRAIFTSRQLPAIERVVALAAAPGAGKRGQVLLDGFVLAAATTRRPLQFTQPPSGWAELEKDGAQKARLAKLNSIVLWPGKTGVDVAAIVKPLTADEQARFEAGKTLFTTVCATCHQVDGRGLDGLAPPLLDSEWVLGIPERTIRIVLNGVRGPITVAGRMHTGDMPAFKIFDDDQVASVLTYVRRAWGHTAGPVAPATVKAVRAATVGHSDAWSSSELLQIK